MVTVCLKSLLSLTVPPNSIGQKYDPAAFHLVHSQYSKMFAVLQVQPRLRKAECISPVLFNKSQVFLEFLFNSLGFKLGKLRSSYIREKNPEAMLLLQAYHHCLCKNGLFSNVLYKCSVFRRLSQHFRRLSGCPHTWLEVLALLLITASLPVGILRSNK